MPEPILISISAALTAATEAPEAPEPVAALAQRLETAEAADPSFAEELRAEWEKVSVSQHAESGGVTNQITGNVTTSTKDTRAGRSPAG